jgi:uroporphyrin-III C-methyltransferase/precorrin-2 dehydrogenase/sirohydrochlorin ferrochelatase
MNYFPIFLRLQNQPVLVVGGGVVAARKIELLRKANADVTVVAPEIIDSLAALASEGSIKYRKEEFKPEHLDGMRLAIGATNKRAVNAWVAHQAEVRNIPVNIVDDRELSRFIMPAIVDRSPVIVAVGSSGDAPVLTRRLREMLEAVLPTRLGALARFAGRYRDKVKRRVVDGDARRKFWERFFDGDIAADVLAGREQQAQVAADRYLNNPAAGELPDSRGEVALVGAGPGDPGLLTLRALRVLQNADVVLYDRLVSSEILDLARRDAEMISVGKSSGHAPIPQDQINALLVEHALAGKRVVRLKGGDPFVFGRGGEELEALLPHGIRFEVVPGVTAAAGCAAYAGIPLTHRDYAQTLTLVTGHFKAGESDALDWSALARPGQTIVFYMGLGRMAEILARLQEYGAPRDRAAAVIEQGTQPTQRVVTGTIGNLVERVASEQIKSPALLIVGEVTRLHETLSWFNSAAGRESLANSILSA